MAREDNQSWRLLTHNYAKMIKIKLKKISKRNISIKLCSICVNLLPEKRDLQVFWEPVREKKSSLKLKSPLLIKDMEMLLLTSSRQWLLKKKLKSQQKSLQTPKQKMKCTLNQWIHLKWKLTIRCAITLRNLASPSMPLFTWKPSSRENLSTLTGLSLAICHSNLLKHWSSSTKDFLSMKPQKLIFRKTLWPS